MKTTVSDQQIMQSLVELPFLLLTGGVLYWTIEILWRGWSHWSMALCGAICFFAIYQINKRHRTIPFLLRALLGAGVILAVEFAAGCIFNLWLKLEIWNYSALPYNLLGQICLPFFFLWFLLCIVAGFLCKWIRVCVFYDQE